MPDLPERIVSYIAGRSGPCSSLHLADRFLKLGAVDEDLATRLLSPVLQPLGFAYTPAGGWSRRPGAESGEARAGSAAPAREGADRNEPPRAQIACAAFVETASSTTSGGARLRSFSARRLDGGEPLDARARDAGVAARIGARDWIRLSRLLDGAEAVFLDPRREAPALLAELQRRALPGPAAVRSLQGAVRGAVRIPRGCPPSGIAEALGAAWSEEETAAAAAANVAACLSAAREIRARRSGAAAEPSAGPATLPASLVAGAPASPGVYKFFDSAGKLLYVGKSSNLRRRLSSYAAGRSGDERPVIRDLREVARVEWRPEGSDLAALLEEARLIALQRPAANVQRSVRERHHAYAASRLLAYLLPGAEPGAVIVLFARHASFEGACRVGPRGGGLAAVRRILSRLWRRRKTPSPPPRSAGSELMNSWLARHGDRVSRVELDACRSEAHARGVLERAIREQRPGAAETSYHR